MHRSAIERILAIANAQEAGCLLKGLGADAGNFIELRSGAEFSMLIAVGDDIERSPLGHAGDEATRKY